MQTLTRFTYAVFGTAALAMGVGGLINPAFLGDEVAASGLMQHLVREEAALFIFVGLMLFWCLRHFDIRRPVHLSLFTFMVIFAGIHWLPVFSGHWYPKPLIANTVPALILAITAPWKER